MLVPMTLVRRVVAYHGYIEWIPLQWNAVFEPAHDTLVLICQNKAILNFCPITPYMQEVFLEVNKASNGTKASVNI